MKWTEMLYLRKFEGECKYFNCSFQLPFWKIKEHFILRSYTSLAELAEYHVSDHDRTLLCSPVLADDAPERLAKAFVSRVPGDCMVAICKDFHLAIQSRAECAVFHYVISTLPYTV